MMNIRPAFYYCVTVRPDAHVVTVRQPLPLSLGHHMQHIACTIASSTFWLNISDPVLMLTSHRHCCLSLIVRSPPKAS